MTILDAVQVIRDVLRNPKSSLERKRKHFANVALSEVYLEAIPTAFLYIMLISYSNFNVTDKIENEKAVQVLRGNMSTADQIFLIITLLSSLLSGAFGIAR